MIGSFFETYPYLAASLVWLALALAVILAFPHRRAQALCSGLLAAPFALASVIFVPEYWQPVRIASFLAGPEDVIFSFANGVIVWPAAVWLMRDRIAYRIEPARAVRRYLAFSAGGVIVAAGLYFVGLGVMPATVAASVLVGAVLLARYRAMWPVTISGGLIFATAYTAMALATMAIWPHFASQWSHDNLTGIALFNLPIEEVAWALSFGAVWPMGMIYVFDGRLVDPATRSS